VIVAKFAFLRHFQIWTLHLPDSFAQKLEDLRGTLAGGKGNVVRALQGYKRAVAAWLSN
jgi:hypothetical protein